MESDGVIEGWVMGWGGMGWDGREENKEYWNVREILGLTLWATLLSFRHHA